MIVRLFGPLEIEDGPRLLGPRDVGGVKPKQILEILLTHRGRSVSKERIANLLWDEDPPVSIGPTIESYVSILRRALEPWARNAQECRFILTERGAYRFATGEAEVDLDRFDLLLTRGGLWNLKEALDIVRGEVLEDELKGPWAVQLRAKYRQRHLAALGDMAQAALDAGDLAGALSFAEEAVARDPVREQAHQIVMVAAYALGRQDAALRAFERCRVALSEELGVSPLQKTNLLHLHILQQQDPMTLLRGQARPSTVEVQPGETADEAAGEQLDLALTRLEARRAIAGDLQNLEAGLTASRLGPPIGEEATVLHRRVLVIETDPHYLAVIAQCLAATGCEAVTAATLAEGLDTLGAGSFDLVIWGSFAGHERAEAVVPVLRAAAGCPLIVLDSSYETAAKAVYEIGADQVLSKPVVPRSLIGAIKLGLRNDTPIAVAPSAWWIKSHGVIVDGPARTLTHGDATSELTREEWQLFAFCLANPNRYLTTAQVLAEAWPENGHSVADLEGWATALAAKLASLALPWQLVRVNRHGYVLAIDSPLHDSP